MLRTIFIAAAALACVIAPASAQEGEIVVTAQRYANAYQSFTIPHISRIRRADFAVAEVVITSDTRDETQRNQELRQALQSLTRFANRDARISVALIDEEAEEAGQSRIIAYTVEKAMESLRNAGRPDSSLVVVTVRTRVTADDTRDSIDERIDDFVADIPRPGRVEVNVGGGQLTLTDPRQYRAQLVADIAADANAVASALGPGYGATLTGLENPIAWRRAGDLDLRLFVPYSMTIMPRS
jgi:hypothetical protein